MCMYLWCFAARTKKEKKRKKKLKKFRPSVCGRIRWLPFARMLPLFLSSSPVHCGTLWGRRPSRSTAAYRLHARRFKEEEEEGGREKAAGVCSGWGRKKGGVVHHRAEWSGGDVTYRITRNNVYIRAGKMEERERERERERDVCMKSLFSSSCSSTGALNVAQHPPDR